MLSGITYALWDNFILYRFKIQQFNNNASSFSRQAGHRFGEQLWRVAPQVLEYSTDADEELREHCLQALEAFVLKCPKEVQPHIPTVKTCFDVIIMFHLFGTKHCVL